MSYSASLPDVYEDKIGLIWKRDPNVTGDNLKTVVAYGKGKVVLYRWGPLWKLRCPASVLDLSNLLSASLDWRSLIDSFGEGYIKTFGMSYDPIKGKEVPAGIPLSLDSD